MSGEKNSATEVVSEESGVCDHRMTADYEGMKKGECEPCAVHCPYPDLTVEHGQLCSLANKLLEGASCPSCGSAMQYKEDKRYFLCVGCNNQYAEDGTFLGNKKFSQEVPAYAKVRSEEIDYGEKTPRYSNYCYDGKCNSCTGKNCDCACHEHVE